MFVIGAQAVIRAANAGWAKRNVPTDAWGVFILTGCSKRGYGLTAFTHATLAGPAGRGTAAAHLLTAPPRSAAQAATERGLKAELDPAGVLVAGRR